MMNSGLLLRGRVSSSFVVPLHPSPSLLLAPNLLSHINNNNNNNNKNKRGVVVWKREHVLKCSESSETTTSNDNDERSISSYKLCAALGGVGFLETAYLSYLKLSNTEAFCPFSGAGAGGGNCTTILTSPYSSLFGVPLSLFGMLAYGLVTLLALRPNNNNNKSILLGTTTSMAVASAYLLYIINTQFSGESSCFYCFASATLSFTLFFITLKTSDKMLPSQLFIATLVLIVLTASYNAAQPVSSSLAETELPYVEIEITKESSPFALSLARHLRSIGAKLYGAFWCSHCLEQKEMFGSEAAKLLDYVECFPEGVRKGTKMAKACYDAKLEGFPTWEINGQVLSGEKQLSELATLSGMRVDDPS